MKVFLLALLFALIAAGAAALSGFVTSGDPTQVGVAFVFGYVLMNELMTAHNERRAS